MIAVNKSNSLKMGSKYENIELVSTVATAEFETSETFRVYFQEMLQNYKRAAGYIYSGADLAKLHLEERPAFVYNLLLPILLQISGNFLNNQSRVEALPRTPGDHRMNVIMTDLIDYAHYTANNLTKELAMAFVNAIIGRVGWIYQDWSYMRDPEGMIDISCWDPFRVMWEPGFRRRDLTDCNYLINRGWYSPEEIKNMYALDNDDLYEEITEKAKLYLGTTRDRNKKLIPYLERTFGPHLSGYQGKDQGYDEVTLMLDGMLYNNGNYFDGSAGLFKVVEFHERRQEKQTILYDPTTNNRFNITKAVETDNKNGVADRNKVAAIRDRMLERGIDAIITTQVINQIYQTAVCPSFNLVLYDEPYVVQNGQFKLTPVFCFDFGQESLDWKSYVDHLIDPVSGYNLKMNTLTTYLQKATTNETWAEEDALGEHEDAFLENKIGALKYVKPNKLDKIKQIPPAPLPPGLVQGAEIDKMLTKEISGVRDNALGTQESSSESGKLYNSRVAQSDILQTLAQDNAIGQIPVIGKNTVDYILEYMQPDRAIRIVGEESDPYWLQINTDAVTKLFYDSETGSPKQTEVVPGNLLASKYDIVLSKAPFGEAAKEREFTELMALTNVALSMQRPDYVKFEYLIKNSRLRVKEDWIMHIQEADQAMAMQNQMAVQQQQDQLSAEQMQKDLERRDKEIDIAEKEKEHQAENILRAGMLNAVTQ